jgi:hypothetical protein
VFGYNRCTNGFDSRKNCDKRRYEYCLPEWAFDPRQGRGRAQRAADEEAEAEAEAAQEAAPAGEGQGGAPAGAALGAADKAAAAVEADALPDAQPAAAAGAPAGAGAGTEAAAATKDEGAAAEAAEAPGSAISSGGGAPFVFDEACTQRLSQILSNVSPPDRLLCWQPCVCGFSLSCRPFEN